MKKKPQQEDKKGILTILSNPILPRWATHKLEKTPEHLTLKGKGAWIIVWEKSYDTPKQYFKHQRHHSVDKGPSSQSYGFSSSHVWMWELDHEEGWALKNWCFWTVVLEKTLESPLDCKEIKAVNPKGNQPWIFIGRTDAEAEHQYFGHLMQRANLLETTLGVVKIEAGEDEGDREWGGWMASPTQWTWIWANSRRDWRTGKLGVLQFMGLQRVRHYRATKQQHRYKRRTWQ